MPLAQLTQSESPSGQYNEQNFEQLQGNIANNNNSEHLSDILVIEPIDEHIRRKERLKTLHKAFCIKHATQIRKRLFLAALNKGIQAKAQTFEESSSLVIATETDATTD